MAGQHPWEKKNWVREHRTLFPYDPPLERRRVSNQVWAPWLVSAPLGLPRLAYHQRSAVARPPLGSVRLAYHHRSAARLEETSVAQKPASLSPMCFHPPPPPHRHHRRRLLYNIHETLYPIATAAAAMPPLGPTPATLLLTHSIISTMARRGLDLAFTPGDSDGRVDDTIGGSRWTAVSV